LQRRGTFVVFSFFLLRGLAYGRPVSKHFVLGRRLVYPGSPQMGLFELTLVFLLFLLFCFLGLRSRTVLANPRVRCARSCLRCLRWLCRHCFLRPRQRRLGVVVVAILGGARLTVGVLPLLRRCNGRRQRLLGVVARRLRGGLSRGGTQAPVFGCFLAVVFVVRVQLFL
jgi:hypothetical protein